MLCFLICLTTSLEREITSNQRIQPLDQFGFLRGGMIRVKLYTKSQNRFRFFLIPKDNYPDLRRNDTILCTAMHGHIPHYKTNITENLKYIEWYQTVERTNIYQPLITTCTNITKKYKIIYTAVNPKITFDYRYINCDFIALIACIGFLITFLIGASTWCMHPKFFIPIQIINTITAALSAVTCGAISYKYRYISTTGKYFPYSINLAIDVLRSATIMMTIITGYLCSIGYSIISNALPLKIKFHIIFVSGLVSLCIFLVHYITVDIWLILLVIFLCVPVLYIIYQIICNLAMLLQLSNDVIDSTTALKVGMSMRVTIIWLVSMVPAIIALPQDPGCDSFIFWSITLFIQVGILGLSFTFSGGYVADEPDYDYAKSIIYLEEPNNDSSLMVIRATV